MRCPLRPQGMGRPQHPASGPLARTAPWCGLPR